MANLAPDTANNMILHSPKELAAFFALTVTHQTAIGHGCIAKNGEMSLFRILALLLPEVRSFFIFLKDLIKERS
jgi:hypothetical protein